MQLFHVGFLQKQTDKQTKIEKRKRLTRVICFRRPKFHQEAFVQMFCISQSKRTYKAPIKAVQVGSNGKYQIHIEELLKEAGISSSKSTMTEEVVRTIGRHAGIHSLATSQLRAIACFHCYVHKLIPVCMCVCVRALMNLRK